MTPPDQPTPGALDPDGGVEDGSWLQPVLDRACAELAAMKIVSADPHAALAALRTPPTPAREAEVLERALVLVERERAAAAVRKASAATERLDASSAGIMSVCGRLDAAIRALIPPGAGEASQAGGEVEIDYEVWQQDGFGDGDAMVAGSTSLADAQHYAAVYDQDAPAWVVEVTRRHFRNPTHD